MRYLYYFILSFVFITQLPAQAWMQNVKATGKNATVNFYDIKKAANEYFQLNNILRVTPEQIKDDEFEQYKRWEHFVEQRVGPSGVFYSPSTIYEEYIQYKNTHPEFYGSAKTQSAAWKFYGPENLTQGSGGAGRLNCMAFEPGNASVIYVGTACGGIWKTTDAGVTWNVLGTDFLNSLSVSEIVVDPSNTNIIYASTGDKYGAGFSYITLGHYSLGVLKSNDGGATWVPAGLSANFNDLMLVQRLLIHPTQTNILFAATNTGIYRSTDGAASWTLLKSGSYTDMELNPKNPDVIYAGTLTDFWRSNDGGATWVPKKYFVSSGRTSIAVTPADTAIVYIWGDNFYRSIDGGTSYVLQTNPANSTSFYNSYDRVVEVSPTNADVVYTGGVDILKSYNGGASWNIVSSWSTYPNSNYCHADNHDIRFAPGSSTLVYSCNDGGLFKTTSDNQWENLSEGLKIKQYYRIGTDPHNLDYFMAGAQDNGTDIFSGQIGSKVLGGDGMECLVDHTDPAIVYGELYYGYISKSIDSGKTFTYVYPTADYGDWLAPYIMHPTDHNTLYMGRTEVYKTTDAAATWTKMTNYQTATDYYTSLVQCQSAPEHLYASSKGVVVYSKLDGLLWNTITGTLPVSQASISSLAVNNNNPNQVWATFSGFSNGNKVFYSADAGTTWTNISGTLPNLPVNTIVYENSSKNGVYIGTDVGVFYKDTTMTDWIPYNTDLPNVIIYELEVHHKSGKLRAATFGRGIWDIDLINPMGVGINENKNSILSSLITIYPNPAKNSFKVSLPADIKDKYEIKLYNSLGAEVVIKIAKNNISSNIEINTVELPSGIYFLAVNTGVEVALKKVVLNKD